MLILTMGNSLDWMCVAQVDVQQKTGNHFSFSLSHTYTHIHKHTHTHTHTLIHTRKASIEEAFSCDLFTRKNF